MTPEYLLFVAGLTAGTLLTFGIQRWREANRAWRRERAWAALIAGKVIVPFSMLDAVLDEAVAPRPRVVHATVTAAEVEALLGTLEDGK